MMLRLAVIFIMLLAGLPSTDLAAQEPPPPERVYPVPMAEMADVVADWLAQSRMRVFRQPMDGDGLRLLGRGEDRACEITLQHQNVMATRVIAACILGDGPASAMVQGLWSYLNGYQPEMNPASASAGQGDIPKLVISYATAVVCIHAHVGTQNHQLTGLVIDKKGLIICTAHGLSSDQTISVSKANGEVVTAVVEQLDDQCDLALLRTDARLPAAIDMNKGRSQLSYGSKVYAVGCPITPGRAIFPGVVNGPARRANHQPLWQVLMQIHPGSSGSPVFDEKGDLAGLVKGRYRGTETLGFLIPYATIIDFLNQRAGSGQARPK